MVQDYKAKKNDQPPPNIMVIRLASDGHELRSNRNKQLIQQQPSLIPLLSGVRETNS
jgi:hypothetical protein